MTHYTLLSCIESKRINPTQIYGRFALGNFIQAQGLTVANALRRALLSELVGAAICFAEIKDAAHEYESLAGVRESVLDILLNLRQIVLKSQNELFNTQFAYLHIKGPGVVRARDLKLPYFISVVNPNQPIATLSHKGELYIKVLINCGKTYLTHTPGDFNYENQINKLRKRSWLGIGYNPANVTNYVDFWQKEKAYVNRITKLKSSKKKKQVTAPINSINKTQKNKSILNNPISKTDSSKLDESLNTALPKEKLDDIANGQKNQKKVLVNSTKPKLLGYFPIDAIFAPVLRVNYTIEAVTKTKEKVFMEIWTNGAVDPRQAIHRTVKALIKLFLPLQTTQINPLPQLNNPFRDSSEKLIHKDVEPILTFYKQRVLNNQTKLSSFKKNLVNLKSFHRVLEPLNKAPVLPLLCEQAKLEVGFSQNNKKKIQPINQKPRLLKLNKSSLKKSLISKQSVFLKTMKLLLKPQKKLKPFKIGTKSQFQQVTSLANRNSIEILLNRPDPKKAFQWEEDEFLLAKMVQKNRAFKPLKQPKKSFEVYKPMVKPKQDKAKTSKQKLTQARLKAKKKVLKRRLKLNFLALKKNLFYGELSQLQLPSRVYLDLKNRNIHTIQHLIQFSKSQLRQMETLNENDIKHIQIRVRDYVLTFMQNSR